MLRHEFHHAFVEICRTDEIGIISTNTEQEQDQQQQQLSNSLDHNHYVARGQKAVFTQDRV